MTRESFLYRIPLREAEKAIGNRPGLLKSVPYYGVEEILFRHEPLVPGASLAGAGGESLGLRLLVDIAPRPVFAKIWSAAPIPPEIIQQFLYKIEVDDTNLEVKSEDRTRAGLNRYLDETIREVTDAERMDFLELKRPEAQAIGFRLGKFILPKKIPPLIGVLTFDSYPVGHLVDSLEGKAVNLLRLRGKMLQKDAGLLYAAGIALDCDERNGMRDKNGRLSYVDLLYMYEHNTLPEHLLPLYAPFLRNLKLET